MSDDDSPPELPEEVREEAERLTRLARDAVDPDEAEAYRERREDLLAAHGYTARVREDDAVLVLHPASWLDDDGVVRTERIEDIERGVEVELVGGGGDDDWDTVEAHNAALVERVATEHGPVHAANARSFADFLGNHCLCRVESATSREVSEFLTEYYPRNGFASSDEKEVVEQSLELLFEAAGTELPDYR